MNLYDIQLNRNLYKTQPQTLETLSADSAASNLSAPPSTVISSGNSVYDVNTNSQTVNGETIVNINADNITAGTLTGRTFQTAATGERIVIHSTPSNLIDFYSNSTLYGSLEVTNSGGEGIIQLTSVDGGGLFVNTGVGASGFSSIEMAAQGGSVSTSGNASNGFATVSATGGAGTAEVALSASGSSTDISLTADTMSFNGTTSFNLIHATGSTPQIGQSAARFNVYGAAVHYTSLINDSDLRLKQNISPLNYGIDAIMALKPVFFEYKEYRERDLTDERRHLGFIAQDVELVIPEVVSADSDDGVLNLSSVEIIPILVKAIQELKNELELLKLKK